VFGSRGIGLPGKTGQYGTVIIRFTQLVASVISAVALPPVNILLVDDQPAKLLSYEAILAELGETLISATSPGEAFEQLLRTEVAVVLMDVQMPELDGFELARMIHEHPRFEKTAIIFVSAIHLTDVDRLKGYAAGAVDYLSVPIVPEVLRAKVQIFVDLHRKTRQLESMNEELERRVQQRTGELEASARRLQSSEKRRSLALATGSMGSWDWNALTGELMWDAGQYRIFGVEEGPFIPSWENVSKYIFEADRAVFLAAIDEVITKGQSLHAEFRIVRPDGQIRWCLTSGVTTSDPQSQDVHLSGVTYDITDRKLNQQALERMNEDLEQRIEERTREREAALAQLFEAQKTETIGQLTGGVAHDFNNLLMAILGNLELLKKRVSDERTLRLVNNAFEGAQRGTALTKRLLAFARRQELNPQPIQVTALVDGIQDLLVRALSPVVAIKKSFPPDLRSVFVDANQLELALLNLAVNARDAMPNGGTFSMSAEELRVNKRGREQLVPGDYVCLSVSDTGHGMDDATLVRATEPFFTTKGPGKGTGLGLSMVHGMVAQSGGALQLSSQSGQGTTVRLILPVASVSPPPLAEFAHQPLNEETAAATILLVDDDALVRAGAAEMLKDLGHTVMEAESANQALELLKANPAIALLLTDHVMPGMTGGDLIEYVGNHYPNLRTILASGFADLPGRLSMRPHIRLSKPFTQEELRTAIAHALSGAPLTCNPMLSVTATLRPAEFVVSLNPSVKLAR
jgi:signal transduction histidine kinase/response regulator RpfG family c-di-GMP phosphodiesterase